MFDAILAAVLTLLQGNLALKSAGIAVTRRKRGTKWDTDALPCLFISGGRRRRLRSVMGASGNPLDVRQYQVFAALVSKGNYLFRSNQQVIPNITDLIWGAMLVSTLPGTPVWRSDLEGSDEYEDEALEVGFELNLTEVWYTTTEPRL